MPSVSELQLLLPGVIQDISQGEQEAGGAQAFHQQVSAVREAVARHNTTQAVRGPNPTIIPEPKRLDREECRLNLLHHVEDLQVRRGLGGVGTVPRQGLVEARLQEIEDRVEGLEGTGEQEAGGATPPLASLLQDLRSAQRLNTALPDRL